MSAEDDREQAVERLLDLFLYAPIGLVATGSENLDEYIRKGREKAMVARTVGEFALRGVDDRLAGSLAGMEGMIREFLRIVVSTSTPSRQRPTADAAPTGAGATGSVDDLIAGYDAMTAREILPLLDGLDDAALSRVEHHEMAGRNRSTVLARIRRLRA